MEDKEILDPKAQEIISNKTPEEIQEFEDFLNITTPSHTDEEEPTNSPTSTPELTKIYATTPSIDIDQIKSIPGIDLNKPITKETVEELNYAFVDNNTFPDGTMVKVTWNDETNECELSVRCTTGLKADVDNFVTLDTSDFNEDAKIFDIGWDEYAVVEEHKFKIPTTGNLEETFNALDNKLKNENWTFNNLANKSNDKVQLTTYKDLFKKVVGRDPSIYEYSCILDYKGDSSHDKGLLTAKDVYTIDGGYLPPEENINIIHKRNCEEMTKTLGNHMGDPASVTVRYENGKYIANIYGVDIPYDETNVDSLSKISSKVTSFVLDEMESKPDEYGLINVQRYINQRIKDKNALATADLEYLIDLESGNVKKDGDKYIISTPKYNITLTEEELKNPNCDKVNAIIKAANLQNDFTKEGYEASVKLHQNGEKVVYNCLINGEKKYFILENGKYYLSDDNGNKTDGKEYKSINDYYKGENEPNKNYYYNNKKLSRNQNSGICSPDKDQYDELISGLNKVNIRDEVRTDAIASAIQKIQNYYNVSGSSISTAITRIDSDIDVLSRLIDSVVMLYTQHNADLKNILDGLLTGQNDSLIDRLFSKYRNNTDISYSDEQFQQIFLDEYDKFLNDTKEIVLLYKNMQEYGVPICDDENSNEYKFLVKCLKEKKIDVDTVLRKKGDQYYLDYSKYEELFGDYLNGDGKKLNNKELQTKLIDIPSVNYSSFTLNYEKIGQCIKDYNNLANTKNYVKYLFDSDFKKELEYVRQNGKPSGGTTYDWMEWMTPSEIAMWQYLRNKDEKGNLEAVEMYGGESIEDYSYSNMFKKAISPMTNERKGRYEAAEYVLNMIKDGKINFEDRGDRFVWGLIDGFTNTITQMYHCIDHNTQDYEWKRYYITKFIEDSYDMSSVAEKYNAGKISDLEYEMGRRLSGSTSEKGSYKMSDTEKTILNANYDLGKSLGDTAFQLALMSLTAGASSATKLARIARYGSVFASTYGEKMSSGWDSIVHDSPEEYWTLAGKSGLKSLTRTSVLMLVDYTRGKIKTKYKKPSSSTKSASTAYEKLGSNVSEAQTEKFRLFDIKKAGEYAKDSWKQTKWLQKAGETGVPFYSIFHNSGGTTAGALDYVAKTANSVLPDAVDKALDADVNEGLKKLREKTDSTFKGKLLSNIIKEVNTNDPFGSIYKAMTKTLGDLASSLAKTSYRGTKMGQ